MLKIENGSCIVEFENRQREVPLSVTPETLGPLVQTVLANEREHADYVSIYFIGDRAMRRYHRSFFNDPSSTDCMSFPMDIEASEDGLPRHLGDIFVCPKTAKEVSASRGLCFWEEMSLYIVHGLLHLLGYDDISPSDRKIMRQRERSAMTLLRRKDLFLQGTLR